MEKKRLYRVSFSNNGKVFEVYVRSVASSNLFGFIELEEIVFGEKSAILVDPTEESLRSDFEHTKRFFVPLHNVIRIDEMEKETNLRPRVVSMKGKASQAVPQSKQAPFGGPSEGPPSSRGPQLSSKYIPNKPLTKN